MDLIERNVLLAELRTSCKWHAENSRELSLLQRDINIVMEQPGVEIDEDMVIEYCRKRRLVIMTAELFADWFMNKRIEYAYDGSD